MLYIIDKIMKGVPVGYSNPGKLYVEFTLTLPSEVTFHVRFI
jgi:hypothetical protein